MKQLKLPWDIWALTIFPPLCTVSVSQSLSLPPFVLFWHISSSIYFSRTTIFAFQATFAQGMVVGTIATRSVKCHLNYLLFHFSISSGIL